MPNKTEKRNYFFEVVLNWQGGRKGIITANDVKDTIRVATPPEFTGGVPDMWSPEHLFLSSLSSCFMTTYLAFAEKRKLTISHFECNAIGQIELTDGHLAFTNVNLYPKIYVQKEENIAAANAILLEASKYCIIANSIKPHLIHHGQVLLEKHLKTMSVTQ